MPRPAILIAEPEPADALSTRKLVMETGKFNVLTAHSSKEAIEIEQQSPAIVAMVAVAGLLGVEPAIKTVKGHRPGLPVILLSPNQTERFDGVDHHVSSHDPEALLNLCRELFGDPRESK
jgi:CheY-like chemotaxis protein